MIFLVEFDVHDGDAPSKLYVSTHGISSGPTDTPANQYYAARMKSVGRIERSMFGAGDGVSGGTTGGRSEVGFGNISVLNGTSHGTDELIDYWKDLAFREVIIKSLANDAQPFSQAVTRFIGSVEQLVSTNALEQYDIILHDRLQNIDKPLLINTYLGTTNSGGLGTVEGDVDQKDTVKQKLWGTVHNCQVTDVNHYDLIWQVSDGPVVSITVYDGGVLLTDDGDVGTLEALFAAPTVGGHYATCNVLGLFKTGISPVGTVTADVVEGATAADRTAAQIAKRMLAWFAEMYDETLSLSASDVAALDALNSAQCGIVVRDTESAIDAMMRVLNSVGAWLLPQSNSPTMYNIGRLDPPDDEPVASYDLDESIGGNPQRVESGDDSKGVPCWRVTVRYDQLDTVQQSSDLFGEVTESDPVRTQYLATEWRQATAEDEDVLEQWPNAPSIQVDTRLISQADAAAEADRLLALHGVKRDIWRLVVPMSDDPQDDPGVGEVVELTSRGGRMGLGPEPGLGESFMCLGRIDDFDDVPLLTLTLYGPFPNIAAADVVPIGTLAATESADTAALTASIPLPVTGTLAATEGPSTASFAGTVGTALDSEVSAWVSAVVAAGGSVSSGRQTIINTLVAGLKTDGVWSKLDRLPLYAAENVTSALIDLKSRTLATLIGAPSFTVDRGYTFDNTAKAIDTGFNPATAGGAYTQDSAHLSVWPTNQHNWGLIGHYNTMSNTGVELACVSTQWMMFGPNDSTAPAATGNFATTGLMTMTRTASNARRFYINGSSAYSDAVVSTGVASLNFYVGATNNDGTVIHPTAGQIASASIGGGLDATDNANLYTRLRTYMTAVGVP